MELSYSEELAEFVGMIFGDGSVTFRKGTNKIRFQLRGDAKSDKEHYHNFVIPLCNKLLWESLGRNVSLVKDKKRNSFGVCIESPKLKSFFDWLKVPIGVKKELYVPNWIKKDVNFSKAFVRGLFDTDGTISFKRNNTAKSNLHVVGVVSICLTSKNLIFEISEILKKVNLKHYIRSYKGKTNKRRAYRVDIFRPHHKRFFSLIGSHNPKHLTKLTVAEKFGHCPTKTTLEQRRQILKGFLDPLSLYL